MLKTVSLSLEILKMFTNKKPTWKVKELSVQLNENQTKIYRILETLRNNNFLIKDSYKKSYSLGTAIWEMSNSLNDNFYMKELIHPILKLLRDQTGESVFLTILDNEEALTIDAVESETAVKHAVSVGSRTNLHNGASYRSILAYMSLEFVDSYLGKTLIKYTENTMTNPYKIKKELEEIKQKGYAVSQGEFTEGVIATAIPIFYGGKVKGSLTVSGPEFRITNSQINLFIKQLLYAREQIDKITQKYGFYFNLY